MAKDAESGMTKDKLGAANSKAAALKKPRILAVLYDSKSWTVCDAHMMTREDGGNGWCLLL